MTILHWLSDRLRSVVTVYAHTLGRTGTGFVVSADGHLLTAAHCVVDDSDVPAGGTHESETDITVAFRDGGTMHADLIGFDMHADVAVLRLEQHSVLRLWSIPVRRHTYPQPGDVCVIVGNISDQDPRSVAVGTVRNGRWHDPYGRSLLSTVLTDVATGAGTSGGPILDAAGYVVALHTAAYGSRPYVCASCGESFRSTTDRAWHTQRSECVAGGDTGPGEDVVGTTTQLGGGVAAPLLWLIYRAILVRGTGSVVPRSVLPCTTIPCVPGNVRRIRAALGGARWVQPPVVGWCVVRSGGGLEVGDVVVAADGGLSAVPDAVWLLPPGSACAVHVVRRNQDSPVMYTVTTQMLPDTYDVAHGQIQSYTTKDPRYEYQFIHAVNSKLKIRYLRIETPKEWFVAGPNWFSKASNRIIFERDANATKPLCFFVTALRKKTANDRTAKDWITCDMIWCIAPGTVVNNIPIKMRGDELKYAFATLMVRAFKSSGTLNVRNRYDVFAFIEERATYLGEVKKVQAPYLYEHVEALWRPSEVNQIISRQLK